MVQTFNIPWTSCKGKIFDCIVSSYIRIHRYVVGIGQHMYMLMTFQGPPKLIPLSHHSLMVYAGIGMGVGSRYSGDTIYGPLPIAHVSVSYDFGDWLTQPSVQGLALCIYILYPLGSGVLPVFVAGRSPLTAPVVLSHLRKLPPSSIILLPPVLLENVVHLGSPALEVLSNCKRVIYAGAPLQSLTAKALLHAGIKLVTGYGM